MVSGLSALCVYLLTACSTDPYDSGDGKYSYYAADFVMAHTAAAKEVDYAITDDGDSLILSPHAKASWAITADTLYRALLYYNKVESNTTSAFSLSSVPVLRQPVPRDSVGTDPVTFESAWISASGKFLNIGFLVKTGVADSVDTRQQVGMSLDSIVTSGSSHPHVYLTFLHNQRGVPEYYSQKAYVSIPTDSFPRPAEFHLMVYTYDGPTVKTLVLER